MTRAEADARIARFYAKPDKRRTRETNARRLATLRSLAEHMRQRGDCESIVTQAEAEIDFLTLNPEA
jgi:hypothetical protein